jgi:hypothetical protein
MPRSSSVWQRVSRRRPCPVCDKPDWCIYVGPDDSPTAAICARIESAKQCGEAGWLHVLRDDGPTWAPWRHTIRVAVRMMSESSGDTPNLAKLAADCRQAVRPEALEKLAVALGVSAESLTRLGVGWSAQHRAWAFPMSNAAGDVLGVRLRLPGGKKLSVKGGKEGLFIPTLPTATCPLPTTLLIAEGPTDTAALLDLGFHAIGRPSCTGGVALLVDLLQKHRPEGVVIVADADAPGQRGAETLATVLLVYSQSVRIVAPPSGVKDAREWKRSGATTADVQRMIEAAPVRKLAVSARMRRKGDEHHGR